MDETKSWRRVGSSTWQHKTHFHPTISAATSPSSYSLFLREYIHKILAETTVAVKGYLLYKMITSQNGSSEKQIKFFLFRSHVIPVFEFLNIPWISKSVTSQWVTWARVHFWIYLLNHNSLSYHTWPIDRYMQSEVT